MVNPYLKWVYAINLAIGGYTMAQRLMRINARGNPSLYQLSCLIRFWVWVIPRFTIIPLMILVTLFSISSTVFFILIKRLFLLICIYNWTFYIPICEKITTAPLDLLPIKIFKVMHLNNTGLKLQTNLFELQLNVMWIFL